MSTFARTAFDAVGYARGRPALPIAVVRQALARAERPVVDIGDLGCGPGQLARELAQSKHKRYSILGVDPSEKMIDVARAQSQGLSISWAVGTAEEAAKWARPASLDAILAVQAAQ